MVLHLTSRGDGTLSRGCKVTALIKGNNNFSLSAVIIPQRNM